jgi:hypothetical protein
MAGGLGYRLQRKSRFCRRRLAPLAVSVLLSRGWQTVAAYAAQNAWPKNAANVAHFSTPIFFPEPFQKKSFDNESAP